MRLSLCCSAAALRPRLTVKPASAIFSPPASTHQESNPASPVPPAWHGSKPCNLWRMRCAAHQGSKPRPLLSISASMPATAISRCSESGGTPSCAILALAARRGAQQIKRGLWLHCRDAVIWHCQSPADARVSLHQACMYSPDLADQSVHLLHPVALQRRGLPSSVPGAPRRHPRRALQRRRQLQRPGGGRRARPACSPPPPSPAVVWKCLAQQSGAVVDHVVYHNINSGRNSQLGNQVRRGRRVWSSHSPSCGTDGAALQENANQGPSVKPKVFWPDKCMLRI